MGKALIKEDKRRDLNSVFLALLILSNLVANCISMFVRIPNIFALTVTVIASLSVLLTGIKLNNKIRLLICVVMLQFLFSFLSIDSIETTRYLLSFIFIGIPSIVIATKPFDIYKTIKAVQVISLLCIPYFIFIIQSTFTIYDSGELMGIGYAILPVLISSLIIVFGNYKRNWKCLAILNFALVYLASSQLISRGYFFSAIAAFLLLIFFKIKNHPLTLIRACILLIIIAIPFFTFALKSLESSHLYYTLFEWKSGNFLNGRSSDIQNVMSNRTSGDILFGSGIGSYYANFKLDYVHNLFGMLFYEMGIFSTIAAFILIIKGVIKMLTTKSNETQTTIIFLLCTSIIRLMVSYNFWIDQIFWIFISVMLCKYTRNIYFQSLNQGINKIQ